MTALRFLEALPVGLRKATVDDVRQALGHLKATCSAGTRPRPSWCASFSGQWRRRVFGVSQHFAAWSAFSRERQGVE